MAEQKQQNQGNPNPGGKPGGNPGGKPGGNPGGGMGPGQGMGNRPVGDDKGDSEFRADRVHGKVGEGKIVGSYFTKDGAPLKGKATAEWHDATSAAKAKETEALDKTRIPKGYKAYVRDYFDSLTPGNK